MPINANPRLNRTDPQSKFILRLNCVPRSSISTIKVLNQRLTDLTHLARWINSLIRLKSSRTNQNGGLTLCWFCFNPETGEGRKVIQATWLFFRIRFYYSLTDESFRVWFSRAFSSFHITDRPLFGDPRNVLHNEGEARNFNISTLRGRNRRLLRSLVELQAFWLQRRVLYRQNIVKISSYCPPCLFLKNLFVPFGGSPLFASLLSLWLSSFLVFSPSQTYFISPSE